MMPLAMTMRRCGRGWLPPILALLIGLTTSIDSARACMTEQDVDVTGGRIFIPIAPNHWRSPIGFMPAQRRAYLRLGVLEKGDRWEIPASGEDDLLMWKTETAGAEAGLKVWLLGKAEGQATLPLRYVPAKGEPGGVHFIVIIKPPILPPGPPTLVVKGNEFTGNVAYGREFFIRLAKPLPPNHRWEVKEALYSDNFQPQANDWLPFDLSPLADQSGGFGATARGQAIRISFVEKSDGWLLFPQTVTMRLTVDPTPKC